MDGHVLGGRAGLHKTLSKFVIGAMQLEAMMRYTEKGSLLIVGNRVKAQEKALSEGAAILITGGFDTSDYVKALADEYELPVISCTYDTFTVATMINRAIYDQLIKKEVTLVDDLYTPIDHSVNIRSGDLVKKWHELNEESKHSRYPVLDSNNRVIGILTSKDVIGKNEDMKVDKVMTKNPITVKAMTSLVNAAHTMVWEGIELLPVVDESDVFLGVITRQDVIKGLQNFQRQPQIGETIDDIVQKELIYDEEKKLFEAEVTPQLTNNLGTLSHGVFASFVSEACNQVLKRNKTGDMVIENLSIYYMKPAQLGNRLIITTEILESGRKFAKVDVQISSDLGLAGKAMVMVQFIDR